MFNLWPIPERSEIPLEFKGKNLYILGSKASSNIEITLKEEVSKLCALLQVLLVLLTVVLIPVDHCVHVIVPGSPLVIYLFCTVFFIVVKFPLGFSQLLSATEYLECRVWNAKSRTEHAEG